MRNPMTIVVVLGVLFAVATFSLVIYVMLSAAKYSCEVCMTYRGRTDCREALGATEEEARRTAINNACAFLTAGMTETVECTTRTAPASLTCKQE